MFGLELLAGGLLHLAAANGCMMQPNPPKVLVQPLRSVTKYDLSKTPDELKKFDIDTISPYGKGHREKIGGLMRGELRLESRVKFMQEKRPWLKNACLHIESVDIIIHMNPTIYIDKKYPKGSCEYNAIAVHERGHVDIDARIVKQYSALIRRDIKDLFQKYGGSFGPYPLSRINAEQKQAQKVLNDIVETRSAEMSAQRRVKQQGHDTQAEYQNVRRKCHGW